MMMMQSVLKNSKAVWAGKFIACLGFMLVSFSSFGFSNAALADTKKQTMVYEVYAGGFHAVQAKLVIEPNTAKGRYDIVMDAQTRGLLGKLAPWVGTFESHGWIMKDGVYAPQMHKSTATWKGEDEVKEYLYNKNGTFKSLEIQEFDEEPKMEEVSKELTDGTTDALTATLNVLNHYNKTDQCVGKEDVFDGKRRFQQVFKHKQNVELSASKFNIYEGPAAECTVEVVPVAGKWHSKPRGWLSIQEQGRDLGTMPTVWVAQIRENMPAIPVKVRVKTEYGTLFMHLAEYQSGDKTLVAEKRVTEDE